MVIALHQIKAIKTITQETQNALNETRSQLLSNFSVSDLSKACQVIQEIQDFVRKDRFEVAHLRTQDLKTLLVEFLYTENHSEQTKDTKLLLFIQQLEATLGEFDKILNKTSPKKDFEKEISNQQLEIGHTLLKGLETQLKTKQR